MVQHPFTDGGVKNKTQELYSLPDDSLRAEVESLRVDFRSWMQMHFELNEKQNRFLEAMEYPAIQILAEYLADCILFQLPLTVSFPGPDPIGSKFVMPRSMLVRFYGPDGGYTVTGELTIAIDYH